MMQFIKISKLTIFKLSILIVELFFLAVFNPFNSQTFVLFLGILFLIFDYYLVLDFLINRLSSINLNLRKKRKKILLTLLYSGGILIMLESLGQLTFKDTMVIIGLVIIIYWYTWYISDNRKAKN